MITVNRSDINTAPPGWVYAFGKADNTVDLYYAGDTLPIYPGPTPEQLAAIAAAEAKEAADLVAAKEYARLNALKNMSPAEIEAWVAANVTNLAQTKEVLATLGIAVTLLWRRV